MAAHLIEAHHPHLIPTVRLLLSEYAKWLDYDLCLQGFDSELATLPGDYSPPAGRLYLMMWDDDTAGCVALRPKGEGFAELKRLYVRPESRGHGLARLATEKILSDARQIGYVGVKLDTLLSMTEARRLYHSLGFQDVLPPKEGQLANEIYMRLDF